MTEDEEMGKYAEAHVCPAYGLEGEFVLCGERYKEEKGLGVRPFPCVRDEHGEIREQSRKQLFAKVFEELYEFIERVIGIQETAVVLHELNSHEKFLIAEEAADTITSITTMLEALGIDADMRDEAQRCVNKKNRERGRL